MDTLQKYLIAFQKLRIDRSHGIAPHKPILLLSVLQSFQTGQIINSKIYITPELVTLFKSNWSLLVKTNHDCRISYPFYYLKSDKFWELIPKSGFDNINQMGSILKSFSNLNAAIDYAVIKDDLFLLMINEKANNILQKFLLDTYFFNAKADFSFSYKAQQYFFEDIENKILHEDANEYRKEIKQLIKQQNDEEIFIRGSLFKREIPKIYNNTCCISGMKIDATISVSMIDACHIVPFSVSFDDTITNGIALCPNLHRAFDRGLIAIDENYRVVVSNVFSEIESNYSLRKFEGKQILLPKEKNYYPFIDNLIKHKNEIFKITSF
ncbi:MAG: HNH endonuclease [Bacteroidales bacterium]